MKYEVLIINGKAGVGKSTAVEYLKKINPYTIEISMVDPAKSLMRMMNKNPDDKTPQTRAFLCDLKNLLDRYYNISIKNVIKKINSYSYELQQYGLNQNFLVIIHAREKKDIKQLKMMFDATTILIESENRGISVEDASNAADADIYNTYYDYTIYNNGNIKDFENEIKEFFEKWKCLKQWK